MLTGSAGSTGVEEFLFLASATRLVRVDAAVFVDWVCQTPRTGVFVIVAGAFVFCLVAVGAWGGFPLPVPPRGTTIIDNERGVVNCNTVPPVLWGFECGGIGDDEQVFFDRDRVHEDVNLFRAGNTT